MASSSEGKTSEDSAADSTLTDTRLCDACEDDKAVKYCIVCPGSLCDDCTKSHMKSKLTKDHTLCDISRSRLGSSYTRSDEAVDGLSKCLKHHDKELDHFCKDCSCFICVDCKQDHNDHMIISARNDLSIYRSAYHESMMRMMDKVHDFEQYKITLVKTIQQYDETCTELDEKAEHLIQIIQENTERLKEELRTVQAKLKRILGDAESGLIMEIEDADKRVLQRRDLRKVENCAVMSHGLASLRDDIDSLDDYKKKISSEAKTVAPKRILPYRNEIDLIKNDVCIYFSTEYPFNPIIENFTNLKKEAILNVNNPIGDQGYRLCRSSILTNLIIHGKNTNDIRVIDDDHVEKRQIKCGIEIWNLVTVYHGEHVAIQRGSGTRHISLLDGDFNVVATQKEPARDIRAICYYEPHQFLMCETSDSTTIISIMRVKADTFVKQREIKISAITNAWYMELYPDKEFICLVCSDNHMIYKVNISTSSFYKHDVSKFIEERIWSLFIDGNGNAILGDQKGNVHKFDEHMKHELIVKIDNSVRDALVTHGRLVVSSRDDKVYIFS